MRFLPLITEEEAGLSGIDIERKVDGDIIDEVVELAISCCENLEKSCKDSIHIWVS